MGDEQKQADGRATTMALQGFTNTVVRGLLHVPLLSAVVGKQLITLYVVGRKSGKHYTVPVAYTAHDGDLLIGTPFAWGRNLRTGTPVDVNFKGKRTVADVQVIADEAGVADLYAVIARHNRNFARFNKIGFDAQGNPEPADLHRAWTLGARVLRLTLR
jgi:deazaflavin-dependent oxidoreductase (nitroreductase family)